MFLSESALLLHEDMEVPTPAISECRLYLPVMCQTHKFDSCLAALFFIVHGKFSKHCHDLAQPNTYFAPENQIWMMQWKRYQSNIPMP